MDDILKIFDEEDKDELKALDIGAGNSRRVWEGYKTYTTDIRKDSNPDYVMDTRLLNFPNDEFDLYIERKQQKQKEIRRPLPSTTCFYL